MEIKLNLILFIASFLFLIFIISLVKKSKLKLQYSLTWMFTSVLFIVFSIFPQIVDYISCLLYIKGSVNTLFLLILFLLINIILTMSMVISKISERVKTLTQEVGILKLHLDNHIEKN